MIEEWEDKIKKLQTEYTEEISPRIFENGPSTSAR